MSKDFYPSLNHLYPPPTNESTFKIWFTSDGKKVIKMNYPFKIQLCYIVNYNNTLAF